MLEELTSLQKLWRKQLLRLGFLALTGVIFTSMGIACLMAHWGLTLPGISLATSILFVFLGWSIYHFRHPFNRAQRIQRELATLAEKLAPELGSGATSAVDFEQSQATLKNASKELIAQHVEHTHQFLKATNFKERLRLHYLKPYNKLVIFAGSSMVICAFLIAGLEQGRKRLSRALFYPDAIQISETPLAGDIQLIYHFPSYTNKSSRIIEGGNGSIRALVGTQVELRATTEEAVREARLLQSIDGAEQQRVIPMTIQNSHILEARFSVLANGRYSFALHTQDGDHLQDQEQHPIVALPDSYPQVAMDSPSSDIEFRDNQNIPILWRASDDFGVSEIYLVVEPDTTNAPNSSSDFTPIRIPLGQRNQIDKRREGRFNWTLANLEVEPGQSAFFYLEALDNDTINGPKRATSQKRRLTVFSAQRHHEEVLRSQNKVLDAMVDWLGQDLENPVVRSWNNSIRTQQDKTASQINLVRGLLIELATNLAEDKLAKKGVIDAFEAILEHTQKAYKNRKDQLRLLKQLKPKNLQLKLMVLQNYQSQAISQLEKDIIYLDDLLAVQRIDELKSTASELLSAQNELQDILEQYKNSQDPKLREALENQIQSLRQQMLELLQKMAQIKKQLPGEYRNMEAGSMLKVDDQLQRLESLLEQNDLEAAAKELEQLANMIEQMVDSIEDAEEEYGGERYEAIRQELNEFSQAFQQLERQQAALSKRTDELLEQYRKQAMQKTSANMDEFVKNIRKLIAQALLGLEPLAELSFAIRDPRRTLDNTRQRLLDLDALAEQRDFAEARAMGQQALQHIVAYQNKLLRYRQRSSEKKKKEIEKAVQTVEKSRAKIVRIKEELDKLFPDPKDVLSKEQLMQMDNMAKKQQELQKQTQQMGEQMQRLSEDVPLFGGQPQQNLQDAETKMGQASKGLGAGELSKAARDERIALEQLAKLRKALEESAKGNKGGLPMPLGSSGKRGSGRGNGQSFSKENVELPQSQSQDIPPRFRQELLDAAKQKAPKRYEEAVRQYYEELIK